METAPIKKSNSVVLICVSAILCCLILASAVVFSAFSQQQTNEKMMEVMQQVTEDIKNKDLSSPTTVTYDAKNKYAVLTSNWPHCLVLNQETGRVSAVQGQLYGKDVIITGSGYIK